MDRKTSAVVSRASFPFAFSLLLLTGPAAATSFVPMADAALVDAADLIVEARVLSRHDAPTSTMPATDYHVELLAVLKGLAPGPDLVVRVPGGMGPDGIGLAIYGAPRFVEGNRALLFLQPGPEGTWVLHQLLLGAFEVFPTGEREIAMRSLRGAVALGPDSAAEDFTAPRELVPFAAWIADRVGGQQRPADYVTTLTADERRLLDQAFTVITAIDGLKIRWFSFDQGETAEWRLHVSGQPGLSGAQLETAATRALDAWNQVTNAVIRYSLVGTTTDSGGLTSFDEVNAFLFGDPNGNPSIGGPFNCVTGGVLAIGGPWFSNGTQLYRGEQYHAAFQADVVTNANIECFFDDSPDRQAAADEMFAHEVGHTLGLGHACGDAGSGSCSGRPVQAEALMRASVHDDGRGAALNSDDTAGARSLYGLNNVVFSDGFESGNTSAWSATVQ